MVAGYTGSKEDFAPLLAPLSASGYRVVAIDQRGQYESPGPDDPSRYSVAELAEDVVARSSRSLAHVDTSDERSLGAAVRDAVADAQPVPRPAR